MLTIGILDLQGDVSEHFALTSRALNKIDNNSTVITVKNEHEASFCDGIIISGGESTVIGKLLEKTGIKKVIISENIPVFGTCAGMVLLASETDHDQPLLNLIDMKVKRNAFGRQKESFEEEIEVLEEKFTGIFIRAPVVVQVGEEVAVLSILNDKIIAVKQGMHMATSFHPELTENTRLHEYFIKEVLKCVE